MNREPGSGAVGQKEPGAVDLILIRVTAICGGSGAVTRHLSEWGGSQGVRHVLQNPGCVTLGASQAAQPQSTSVGASCVTCVTSRLCPSRRVQRRRLR